MAKKNNFVSRRSFFKNLLSEAKSTAIKSAQAYAQAKIKRNFLRPPGALPESEFLLACSRCDRCKEACPYDAIHLIEDVMSPIINKTPFIDPKYSACRFCVDMPCIKACEDQALALNENNEASPIGKAKVHMEHCLSAQGQYCDYCYNSCPEGVDAIKKGEKGAPIINLEACVGCGKCAYICVSQTGDALVIEPI